MNRRQTSELRQRVRHSRAFVFALIAIAIVWLVSAMSERKIFREHYQLFLDGIDTAQYAVTNVDSTITLDITSNGFYAFRRGMKKPHSVHLNISKKIRKSDNDIVQLSLEVNDYWDIIRNQIDMRGVSEINAVNNKLHLSYARREKKAFLPKIDAVEFQFEGMVGLCDEPKIIPDSVYLYGSAASLAKIDAISAEPQTLQHIRMSGKYRVKLQPDWEKLPDLRISTKYIDIFVPVETFTEKAITVPVEFTTEGNIKRIQLFPSNVTVNCLVPRKDYASVQEKDFQVVASINDDSSNYIKPVITHFPANVRIKSITPSQIQYIIIK
ncbi:MAG: hypothetical protein J6T88_09745 [Bacteroidales bacterium]|nr:hypothetical protein [Bacteroidales bacterium]